MSELEHELSYMMALIGLDVPEREYRFHKVRRWRFDFAFPDRMIAVEVEGGVWSRGRHTRPGGFEADCEKYNEAALLGWRIFRVTSAMVKDGRALDIVERALTQA